jgi:hypothetical protein
VEDDTRDVSVAAHSRALECPSFTAYSRDLMRWWCVFASECWPAGEWITVVVTLAIVGSLVCRWSLDSLSSNLSRRLASRLLALHGQSAAGVQLCFFDELHVQSLFQRTPAQPPQARRPRRYRLFGAVRLDETFAAPPPFRLPRCKVQLFPPAQAHVSSHPATSVVVKAFGLEKHATVPLCVFWV